jgi:hypothetical protein
LRLSILDKGKILAKIPCFLVEDTIRVWFTTGIGGMAVIKHAIQATVQISSAA